MGRPKSDGPIRDKSLRVRVYAAARESVKRRADEEAGGNESEFVRRAMAYALMHMPKNWTPPKRGETR